jgi:hypothetical protein
LEIAESVVGGCEIQSPSRVETVFFD